MQRMRKLQPIVRIILPALIAGLLSSACGGLRRPAPTTPPAEPAPAALTPGPRQEGAVGYPTPRAGSAYDDPTSGVSVVASSLPGAGGAVTAVVLGNVAILGVPSPDPVIHRRIAQQIRSSFPHVVDIRVTTDPATITRIGTIGERIRSQRSVAAFLPELAALATRLPSVR